MYYDKWLTEWLECYVKISSKPRTFYRYSELAKTHIIPELGKYDLKDLNSIRLQHYISSLLIEGNIKTKKGLAASTVNGIINVLRLSLQAAADSGYVKSNAAERLKRPRSKENKIECFTVAEQRKMERYIFDSGQPKLYGILLCLYSGLRIGELMALKWSDIDFKRGILHVSRSCFDGKDENGRYTRIMGSPKTANSKRDIPLSQKMLVILGDIKYFVKGEYVIGSGRNNLITVRNYQAYFSRFLETLKIPHRGFHSLRHTFATRAIESGMDVRTLSEILGHKDPSITLRCYVHSSAEHKREMMNKLSDFV